MLFLKKKLFLVFFLTLGVEGRLLKHSYFTKDVCCLSVNPSNLEMKAQRFLLYREQKTIELWGFCLMFIIEFSSSKHQRSLI